MQQCFSEFCEHTDCNMEEKAWLETILNKNSEYASVSKILDIKFESAVPAGANYASIISRATLDIILRSGRKSKLTLIVKRPHDCKEKEKYISNFSAFKNETRFYCDILTKYDQLMDDDQDNRDKLWCNLIGYKPYNLLVFEDLKTQNFKLADRMNFLDMNYALLVLNSLGRFHAMGHVLMKKGIVSVEDLRAHPFKADNPFMFNLIGGGLRQLCSVMENEWPEEWSFIANKLRAQVNVVMRKIEDIVKSSGDKFQTICHGDFYTSNMMFKYCPYDDRIPVAVKFVDFQCSYRSTHAFDIIFFIHTCIHNELRRTHFDKLIAEYHRSLKSTLTDYGMEAEAPTLEQTIAEVQRLKYYGFIINLIFMPISIADASMSLKIENLNEGCDGMTAYPPEMFNTDKYKSAVQAELRTCLEEGLF